MARNWPCNIVCSLCQGALEIAMHLSIQCPFALQVWRLIYNWVTDVAVMPMANFSIQEWWSLSLSAGILTYTAWNLWKERNRRIFEGTRCTPMQVFHLIKEEVGISIEAPKQCGPLKAH
uniref:Reverse transcriptase zinc-binding domain-containing protein n=1 Tax=Setaria viridis TaxID=4556 RepID=A0A4U6VW06_SETVI|nr:hypothetical protein SEVIR_3G373000v2 [Setaria viridis]